MTGEFLPSHQWKLLRLVDQLVGAGAIRGNNSPQGAVLANVENQCARVDVPDNGNFVAIQIELSRFGSAPIGGNLRKFPDDERLNVRAPRFLVVEIGADIADVRIGQANDLPGVAGICENFLVTGEAGIENDFAAAARDGAGSAAIKYAPVFERDCGGSMRNFRQVVLRTASFITGLGR